MDAAPNNSASHPYRSPNRPFGEAQIQSAPRLAVSRPNDLRLVGELVPRADLRLAEERSEGLRRELAASERSERSLSRYADNLEQRLTDRESVYRDEVQRLTHALEERERALRTLSYRLGRAEALAGSPAPDFAEMDDDVFEEGEPIHELHPTPRRSKSSGGKQAPNRI